jgi:hypothetical protein
VHELAEETEETSEWKVKGGGENSALQHMSLLPHGFVSTAATISDIKSSHKLSNLRMFSWDRLSGIVVRVF